MATLDCVKDATIPLIVAIVFAVTILLGLRPLHFGDLNFAYSMYRC